jgi:hypothetical protein
MQGIPFEAGARAPPGLLNVGHGINDDLLYRVTSCMNAGLQPFFPFSKLSILTLISQSKSCGFLQEGRPFI